MSQIRIHEYEVKYENGVVFFLDPETKVWVSCQEESIEGLNTEQIIGIANECLRAHGLI